MSNKSMTEPALTRDAPRSTTETDPVYVEMRLVRVGSTDILVTIPLVEGDIDRGPGDKLRVCLGFMSPSEANRVGNRKDRLKDLESAGLVLTETNPTSDTRYKLEDVPADGLSTNYLFGWRVTKNSQGNFDTISGPFFLGSNELYRNLPVEDACPQILCREAREDLLGNISNPVAEDPNTRYTVIPSPYVPNQGMLFEAKFVGDSRTMRVFAVVQRPNLFVGKDPAGIPHVVEATREPGSTTKWKVTNIHSAVVEPATAQSANNELIVWEYSGGSQWTTYRRRFFGQVKPAN